MIKAIDDKVIVEELKRTQSEGGIIFPSNAGDPQAYGKIVSLGGDVANKQLTKDEVVVFHVHGGQAIVMGSKLFRVLKYDEIYGSLDDGELKDSLVEMEIKSVDVDESKIKQVTNNIIHPVS